MEVIREKHSCLPVKLDTAQHDAAHLTAVDGQCTKHICGYKYRPAQQRRNPCQRTPRAVVVNYASSLWEVNLLGDVLLVKFFDVDVLKRHYPHRTYEP